MILFGDTNLQAMLHCIDLWKEQEKSTGEMQHVAVLSLSLFFSSLALLVIELDFDSLLSHPKTINNGTVWYTHNG